MGTWLLALATFAARLRGAWYWYRSSQVVAVPSWSELDNLNAQTRCSLRWIVGCPHKSRERCRIAQQMGCAFPSGRLPKNIRCEETSPGAL